MATPTQTAETFPNGTIFQIVPDDKSGEITIALVALVFAATAVAAAFLQALLQYLTSTYRDKCLSGAIGAWSQLTKTSWSIRPWRLKVEYARLNLDPNRVLDVREDHRDKIFIWANKNIEGRVGIRSRKLYRKNTQKSSLRRAFSFYLKDRGDIVLDENGSAISFWHLSIKQKISWLWYCVTERKVLESNVTKAGWSNLLMVLEVYPHKHLVDGYENADIIPSGVDVPIQRVQIFDLCMICYMANLRDIHINVPGRSIEAQNDLIKVSTQNIPGFGQAVTIDGDFEQLQNKIAIANTGQLITLCYQAKGSFKCQYFYTNIYYFDLHAMLYAMVRRWDGKFWSRYRGIVFADKTAKGKFLEEDAAIAFTHKVSPQAQARRFSELIKQNKDSPWSEIWQSISGCCTPTIVKYMAVMPFTGIWSAMPLDLFMSPYFKHLEDSRKSWWDKTETRGTLLLRQHPLIEMGLIYGLIPFIHEISDFCLTGNRVRPFPETYTWAWIPNFPVLNGWKSEVVTDTWEKPFETTLHLPGVVIDLLRGISIEAARKQLVDRNSVGGSNYTLESAIMISLFLVDARLQSIWCRIEQENGGNLTTFYELYEKGHGCQSISQFMRSSEQEVGYLVADFMGLWFELGKRTDILGDTNTLQECLTKTLSDWATDESLIIPDIEPPDYVPPFLATPDMKAQYFQENPESKTRKQFAEWANAEDAEKKTKLEMIRKMLPLLQLRTFLMDLSFRCHTDSSQICLAETDATVNLRLI
ncbi:hypothetical protein ABW19_dt0208185 [Dactylella cylindrospora]|nr:hypothetical protein ABW19_dt0208185 [Dactylella cylindrospora]